MLEASFEAVQPLATLILPTTQPCVSLSVCMSTHYPPLHYSLLTAHYSRHDSRLTAHHAPQASYEAVLLCAALDQAEGQGSGLAVLTFLGGGVFGNKAEWIEEAIARAVVRLLTCYTYYTYYTYYTCILTILTTYYTCYTCYTCYTY